MSKADLEGLEKRFGLREIAEFLRSDRVTRTALSDGSGVVLDVQGLFVYSLNETGMFLVEALCEGATDADTLVARLVAAFEVDEATARADVAAFTAQLSKLTIPVHNPAGGAPRRGS